MFAMRCIESRTTYFIIGNVYCVRSGYLYSEKGIYAPKRFKNISEVNKFFEGIVKFELY